MFKGCFVYFCSKNMLDKVTGWTLEKQVHLEIELLIASCFSLASRQIPFIEWNCVSVCFYICVHLFKPVRGLWICKVVPNVLWLISLWAQELHVFLLYCSANIIQPLSKYIRYENYRVLKEGMIPHENIYVVLFIEVKKYCMLDKMDQCF